MRFVGAGILQASAGVRNACVLWAQAPYNRPQASETPASRGRRHFTGVRRLPKRLRFVGAGTLQASAGIRHACASWAQAPYQHPQASEPPAFRGRKHPVGILQASAGIRNDNVSWAQASCNHPAGIRGHLKRLRFVGADILQASAGIRNACVSWVRASCGHPRASETPVFRRRGQPAGIRGHPERLCFVGAGTHPPFGFIKF